MMSLWAEDATFNSQGDPNSPYAGSDSLRGFWLNSGSFKNHRLSLVPSFKTQITIRGDDEAWLYFECHGVGDFASRPGPSPVTRSWPAQSRTCRASGSSGT